MTKQKKIKKTETPLTVFYKKRPWRYINLIGKRFGKLVICSKARSKKYISSKGKICIYRKWKCKCDCGKIKIIDQTCLIQGNTKSCGCLNLRTGPNHPRWKGNRKIGGHGYILYYSPSHPFSSKGYVLEHRLIMEKKLGRYLTKNEKVHHKNGKRDDNRIENLELFYVGHPPGQRVEDLIKFANFILRTYADEAQAIEFGRTA